ncbi:unnamed protein product [Lampetra fluviatilis]
MMHIALPAIPIERNLQGMMPPLLMLLLLPLLMPQPPLLLPMPPPPMQPLLLLLPPLSRCERSAPGTQRRAHDQRLVAGKPFERWGPLATEAVVVLAHRRARIVNQRLATDNLCSQLGGVNGGVAEW